MVGRLQAADAAIEEIPHPRDLACSVPFTGGREWYACGDPPRLHRQGWKLYVPMTMHNAAEIVDRVAEIAAPAGLHFKYVKDLRTLCKLNAGSYGYAQIGKNIVIYLPEVNVEVLTALKQTLVQYRHACPVVPCARPLGDGLPLHYRYGSYSAQFITIDGQEVPDDRLDSAHAVPDGVDDELAAYCHPVPVDPDVAAFLHRYPIFQALRQQGRSGVFHCMDLASERFQEIVLKVGYHRGDVQVDGSDGCMLLRRELAFYAVLADHALDRLAPALVDALDVPRKVILALEYLPATDLLSHKLDGRLTVDHLTRAWAMIEEIHDHGLYLGDVKLGNFLLCDDGGMRLIDFEAAGIVGQPASPLRTFMLRPEPEDPIARDRIHFLASVLFAYGSRDTDSRQVDLRDLGARRAGDELSAWALDRLVRSLRV